MESKKELLSKFLWTNKDVCSWVGCHTTKACEIIKVAKHDYGGNVKYLTNLVKRDSVLNALGVDLNVELSIYEKLHD